MLRLSQTRVPASDGGIGGDDGLHVRQKILLGARGSSERSDQLAGHHITAENEGACAVARVFKLMPLHFSGSEARNPGCLRSRAWTPVSSSVLIVRSHSAASFGACR